MKKKKLINRLEVCATCFSKVPIAKGYTLFMFIIYADNEILTGLLEKGEIT